jgi:hypothetical protein
MWVYRYNNTETRVQVPTLKTFFFQNHDVLKWWYEDGLEPVEDRLSFSMRTCRILMVSCILFIFTNVIINPHDSYY